MLMYKGPDSKKMTDIFLSPSLATRPVPLDYVHYVEKISIKGRFNTSISNIRICANQVLSIVFMSITYKKGNSSLKKMIASSCTCILLSAKNGKPSYLSTKIERLNGQKLKDLPA